MNNTKDQKINYILYARKSTESEDRQIASIGSQINELRRIAEREDLNIVETITESKSAKAPGRPEFNKMIEKIESGHVDGILCWKLDRLARNPIDGGRISWMLQEETIKHIQTFEKSYYPTDNVLMMAVELGMANQFIRDLRTTTKRGSRNKAEKGWLPARAPIGYLNNKYMPQGEKDIIIDPDTFPVIRKLWDVLLKEKCSVEKIYNIAVNDLGLKNKLSRTQIYRLFQNTFYYGEFSYDGIVYGGRHQPMITKDEFELAQFILGNKSQPRIQTHQFSFTGLMRCGECGSTITAEEKKRKLKNGDEHHHIYYHCIKRKNINCSQKSAKKDDLEKQILEELKKIEIPSEFHRWAIKYLKEENEKDVINRHKIVSAHQNNYNACVKKLERLIDLRINSEINEDEFKNKKIAFLTEKAHLQELINDSDDSVNKWIDRVEILFDFAEKARERFENGGIEAKRSILAFLGSNQVIMDKKLVITMPKPLLPFLKISPGVQALHTLLEPNISQLKQEDFEKIYSQNPIWGG